MSKFPKLCSKAHLLPADPEQALTEEDLTILICSDCPFYKEGQDEELECGAYHLLAHLLRNKVLRVGDILEAAGCAKRP
jgi:hypothetical protein